MKTLHEVLIHSIPFRNGSKLIASFDEAEGKNTELTIDVSEYNADSKDEFLLVMGDCSCTVIGTQAGAGAAISSGAGTVTVPYTVSLSDDKSTLTYCTGQFYELTNLPTTTGGAKAYKRPPYKIYYVGELQTD